MIVSVFFIMRLSSSVVPSAILLPLSIMAILQLPENVREQIEALEHVYNVSYADNKLVARCTGGRHNLIEILKILQENQVGFGSVYSEQPTLNDVFLEITGKALRDKE